MKLKTTIAILFVVTLPLASAQDAPAKEPAAANAPAEVKPEGPLEVRAFRVFDLVGQFPDIIAGIKDKDSLAAAETKLDEISKKLDAEAKELETLPVPPNEDRKKLAAKMELKEQAMQKKMQGIMTSMANLDPAVAQDSLAMLSKFGEKMQKLGPMIEKHFSPDKAQEKEGE